jgi:hypothetical protein
MVHVLLYGQLMLKNGFRDRYDVAKRCRAACCPAVVIDNNRPTKGPQVSHFAEWRLPRFQLASVQKGSC